MVRDKRGGIFCVVISSAVSYMDYPRKINEAYPKPNMTMRLVEFDEDTGQFKAEVLESAYAQGGPKSERRPTDVNARRPQPLRLIDSCNLLNLRSANHSEPCEILSIARWH
jgi:hypothetical protein